MTTQHHDASGNIWTGAPLTALYDAAHDRPARDPIWDTLRAAEAAALPTCRNHPGRPTAGGIGDDYYCFECIEWELTRRKLWLKSQQLVSGGLDVLRNEVQ